MLIHRQSRLPNVKYAVLTVSPGEIFHSKKKNQNQKPGGGGEKNQNPQVEKPLYSAVR